MWCGFFVKINFSFREMILFVRPLKYANFHPEYYTSCVTSGNEFTWPPVFVSEWSFVYHLNLIPCHYWSCKEIFIFWWIFLSDKRNKTSEKKQKEWPTTRRTITEINKPKAAKFLCVSFHDWYLIPVTPRFLCRKVASKQRQF